MLGFRNEKSAQRGSFRPDVPADIRPKTTSVRPSKSWENKHFGTDMPRGRPRKNFGLKNFGLIFRSLWLKQNESYVPILHSRYRCLLRRIFFHSRYRSASPLLFPPQNVSKWGERNTWKPPWSRDVMRMPLPV